MDEVINAQNVSGYSLLHLTGYAIRIVGVSRRREAFPSFNGHPKCCGANINRHVFDGMLLADYRQMVRTHFQKDDPQFHVTKHLRWDIETGFYELHPVKG